MTQITLYTKIRDAKHNDNAQTHLTEKERGELFDLISKRCNAETKSKIARKLTRPLSCWEYPGIFDRVHFNDYGIDYCAGQSYPDEIRTVRKCILES